MVQIACDLPLDPIVVLKVGWLGKSKVGWLKNFQPAHLEYP
jgi:hypothetical protein